MIMISITGMVSVSFVVNSLKSMYAVGQGICLEINSMLFNMKHTICLAIPLFILVIYYSFHIGMNH